MLGKLSAMQMPQVSWDMEKAPYNEGSRLMPATGRAVKNTIHGTLP